MQDLGIGSSSTHGSCSPAKFDSGQGSEGSSGDQGELGHGQGLSSPARSSSSSSSQISSDLQMSATSRSGLQRSGLPPPASKDSCSLLDTSDESSLDSLELDQVRYILKPKLHKYSHVNTNNNNSSAVNNKNKSKAVGTKCHITITNNEHSTAAAPPQPPQPPPPPATTTTATAATAGDESSSSSGTRPVLMIDPRCQEIVSGHVTMVTVEGGAVAGQIERLQAEVTRLKVEKLELLRQNVSAQVEKNIS